MEGVCFFPFPKPWIDMDKCRKWIKACGRPLEQLNENKISGHHYVCSKVIIFCFLSFLHYCHVCISTANI